MLDACDILICEVISCLGSGWTQSVIAYATLSVPLMDIDGISSSGGADKRWSCNHPNVRKWNF